MASVASQLIEKVTAHVQSDSLKDAQEICADGTYFPNNLHKNIWTWVFDLQDSGRDSYEILVPTYQGTQHHIQGEGSLNVCCHENLRSHITP